MTEPGTWRRCSACKSAIALGAPYWVCSVSTCNRKRTGLAFCSVGCWEVHLPSARHREAWAVERRAPATPETAEAAPAAGGGRRRLVRPEPAARAAPGGRREPPREVLVVASRLKEYVRVRSGGFNTSDRVMEALSDVVRRAADEAIRNAERDGRRTVLERDVPDAGRWPEPGHATAASRSGTRGSGR